MEDQTIIELASQLGLAVEQVFDIFVDAQPITAVIKAVTLIGILFATILIYKYMNKVTDDNEIDVVYGVTCTTLIISIIFGLITYDILTSILIPEYTAARELIYLLSP